MEDLYATLESHPEATVEELKKSYMTLIRRYHPDKQQQNQDNSDTGSADDKRGDNSSTPTSPSSGSGCNHNAFVKIDKAWKILSNFDLRAEFDAKWRERFLAQDLPIQDEVLFEDFDYDEAEHVYTYPCRCGSDHVLGQTEADFCFDIVSCETCTLAVRVIYNSMPAS